MDSDDTFSQTQMAFREARVKAMLRELWSAIQGRPNYLLAYDEVRQKLHALGGVYRGLKSVPIRQIVGSVNRYRDFDRVFLPRQARTEERWKSIGRAHFDEVSLPPVVLYQLGDAFFVVDGNHRVSVARQMGQEFIDAEVHEVQARVPIGADIDPHELDLIHEQTHFLERTHLNETRPNADLTMTIPGGYELLLQHIETHQYFQHIQLNRQIDFEEAAQHWCDEVYLPMLQAIDDSHILEEFSRHTAGDLYVWLIEHQYYLRERFGPGVGLQETIRSFTQRYTPQLLKRFWNWVRLDVLRIDPDLRRLDQP